MNKLRHVLGGLLIVVILISLSLSIYNGLQTGYGFVSGDNYPDRDINIMERLAEINIVDGINTMVKAIEGIVAPQNALDLVGALLAAGFGVLKIVAGIIAFPLEIISVVGTHYGINSILSNTLGLLITVYVWFIILSAILGREV